MSSQEHSDESFLIYSILDPFPKKVPKPTQWYARTSSGKILEWLIDSNRSKNCPAAH